MTSFFQNLRRGWRMNSMRRELSRLSDDQLKDIGILRGQIDDLARYHFAGGPRPDSH